MSRRPSRRNRFLRRGPGHENVALQITSMADIFTILLVFLLKNYSVSLSTLAPSEQILLPEAVAAESITEGTKLEIAAEGVLVDEKKLSRLEGFRFDARDLQDDGSSRTLSEGLKQVRAPAGLLILADQKVPYKTLRTVLASASAAGIQTYRLVVVKGE